MEHKTQPRCVSSSMAAASWRPTPLGMPGVAPFRASTQQVIIIIVVVEVRMGTKKRHKQPCLVFVCCHVAFGIATEAAPLSLSRSLVRSNHHCCCCCCCFSSYSMDCRGESTTMRRTQSNGAPGHRESLPFLRVVRFLPNAVIRVSGSSPPQRSSLILRGRTVLPRNEWKNRPVCFYRSVL